MAIAMIFQAQPTLREILVRIDGQVIGHITPAGRWLDRAAFRRLPPTARIRAYLGLIAPQHRHAATIRRVCGYRGKDVSNLLAADRKKGRVRKHGRGRYSIVKEAWGVVQQKASDVEPRA